MRSIRCIGSAVKVKRFLSTGFALVFACLSAGTALAQVHPVDDDRPQRPIARPISGAHTPVPAIPGAATPSPAPAGALPGTASVAANPDARGPALPLAMLRLPALPVKSQANTLRNPGAGIHTMSATWTSMAYSTSANCGSTVGYIFNVGCTISFKMSYCDATMGTTNCFGTSTAAKTDTYQDYYIDATAATASTVGVTYVPQTCCNNTSYGPAHTQTLSNAGTVALATYDVTSGKWVSIVYLTVANASGLNSFADASRLTPQTNFSSGVPAYFAATGYGINNTDIYAIYVESTSTTVSCVAVIPGGTAGAGPCNPTTSAMTLKATLNSNGVYGVNAQWTTAATPGTYSVVLWDRTSGQRLAQTQISVIPAPSATTLSIMPSAGNASPNPVPAATAGVRFAFDSTADQSDSGISVSLNSLATNHNYCLSISDPQGRVYQDLTNGVFQYICGTPPTGTMTLNFPFTNVVSPFNFAANTYAVALYDYNSGAVVGAGAFQLLGYNATTNFTNAAGTATAGTSLLLPKNSTSVAGLQFANDGDAYYGNGNGDTLSGIYYNTGTSGITLTLSCACTSTTVTDSAGVIWNVTLIQVGSGSNAGSTLLLKPQSATASLAMNATITLPNITFNNAPGSSGCTTSCTASTSILPTDGQTWSTTGSTVATNATYFTNGNNTTYAGTSDFTFLGITSVGSPYSGGTKAGEEDHGLYPRMSQALYNVNAPFAAPNNTYADVYSMTVTNNSSTGNTVKGIAVAWPTNYSPGSYNTVVTVDGNSPTKWAIDTSASCTIAANAGFCLKLAGTNTGIPPVGGQQTIYVDLQNLPPNSFSYTDFNITAYNPVTFTLAPSGTKTVFVDQSLTTVDNTAVGVYSLNGTLMSTYFTPTSEGTNTTNPVAVTVQNTGTSQDPFPDYLDAVVIEMPNGKLDTTSLTGLTSGWLYLGSATGLVANTTDYWFGLCSGQFVTADGPVINPPPVNPALPSCGQATENPYSVKPGGQFTFTGKIAAGATAGTIAATMYAHGANGNGWSKGHAFNLNVTTVAASAGFVKDGPYGSPSAIATNTTPQIGADSNTTYGNSFVYEIANSSGAGNNITSATVTVPHADTSGVADTATAGFWNVTAAPTLSGSGYTNCGVTSYTNPTATTDGSIVIGNSGGTCTLTPGGKIDITFPMKAPYKPNDSWIFQTVVNGAVNAAENWSGDTYMNTIVSAQLSIVVWPGAGPGGSAGAPSCTRVCTYTQATSTLDMGSIANLQNNTGTDVVLVSVYTNAASPVGWHLYVDTNNNPANTAGPTNELLTDVDSTAGRQPSYGGVTLNQTALAVMPTTSPGMTLVTASGTTATRNPYDFLQNMQVNINGGPVTGQTSTVTYTWISN